MMSEDVINLNYKGDYFMEDEKQGIETLIDSKLLRKLIVGIGEVSEITGVPTRKLRYWEEKGIINSEQGSDGETRKYNYLNIKKILLIKELIDEGFTLDAAALRANKSIETFFKTFSELMSDDNNYKK